MFKKSSAPLQSTIPLQGGSRLRAALDWLIGPVEQDRSALLRYLSIPLVLALIALLIAVSLTAFSVPKIGTSTSTIAGLAYVYLMLGLMWLPAYTVGYVFYWWSTRKSDDNLLFYLYLMPLVCALFLWFPTLVLVEISAAEKRSMIVPLIGTGLILGYIWIGLVRLMFYVWRKK